MRLGEFDVLVGVNLLREGLDLPEVSLVAVIDADKEGFLRSERSLMQTAGRTARNVNGKVIMYADVITDSMRKMITETNRRRKLQTEYNKKNGITPTSVSKAMSKGIERINPKQEKLLNIAITGLIARKHLAAIRLCALIYGSSPLWMTQLFPLTSIGLASVPIHAAMAKAKSHPE